MSTGIAGDVRSPEATELERRVLAHERVLQALIAYMSRTEPRFLDHLRQRFVEPMKMARHEHEFRDADDYAEEFIRAVMLIGEKAAHMVSEDRQGRRPAKPAGLAPAIRRDRVRALEKRGIWEVTVDGAFWGHYPQKEHALAAMALAKLSLNEP
jgi:hypothetical protein